MQIEWICIFLYYLMFYLFFLLKRLDDKTCYVIAKMRCCDAGHVKVLYGSS